MLRQCEEVLALHLSLHERLLHQLENSGRPTEFESSMLRACEHVLALHLSVQEKLKKQLSRSME